MWSIFHDCVALYHLLSVITKVWQLIIPLLANKETINTGQSLWLAGSISYFSSQYTWHPSEYMS